MTGKAVVLEDGEILASSIVPTTVKPERTANNALSAALEACDLSSSDIDCVVGTGYGRVKIPFADFNVSEITCHGKAAHSLASSVRLIIDVGGQDCKVIRVDEHGKLVEFAMNNKCAAGTGRFLEVLADTLGLKLEELGSISSKSTNKLKINNICTVFVRMEIVSRLSEGIPLEDVVAGVHDAIARRAVNMIKRLKIEPDVVFTGGVAKNAGIVSRIERELGLQALPLIKGDPQITGAVGAAVFAAEMVASGENK